MEAYFDVIEREVDVQFDGTEVGCEVMEASVVPGGGDCFDLTDEINSSSFLTLVERGGWDCEATDERLIVVYIFGFCAKPAWSFF